MRATLATVAVVAAAALTASPATAQRATSQRATSQRAVAPDLAPAAPARPVATWTLVTPRNRGLPTQVTVADSAGGLVAYYRLPGDRAAHPMLVTVLDTDLVLQGETPAGVLTLELFDANDANDAADVAGARGAVAEAARGRWHLDGRQGALRARAVR